MQLEQFTPPEVKYKSILLFGMPGSGKGTQGLILGQLPGMVHVSCGEIFRKLPRGGMLGKEVMAFTSQGNLVPDDLTVRIWSRHLKILELQEFFLPEKHVHKCQVLSAAESKLNHRRNQRCVLGKND